MNIDLENHRRYEEAAVATMTGLELPCDPSNVVAFFEDGTMCLLEQSVAALLLTRLGAGELVEEIVEDRARYSLHLPVVILLEGHATLRFLELAELGSGAAA